MPPGQEISPVIPDFGSQAFLEGPCVLSDLSASCGPHFLLLADGRAVWSEPMPFPFRYPDRGLQVRFARPSDPPKGMSTGARTAPSWVWTLRVVSDSAALVVPPLIPGLAQHGG